MKNTRVTANRQYKDRLFRLLFGSEERKDSILSLYNAINNTSYTECDEMEITTLEDVEYANKGINVFWKFIFCIY